MSNTRKLKSFTTTISYDDGVGTSFKPITIYFSDDLYKDVPEFLRPSAEEESHYFELAAHKIIEELKKTYASLQDKKISNSDEVIFVEQIFRAPRDIEHCAQLKYYDVERYDVDKKDSIKWAEFKIEKNFIVLPREEFEVKSSHLNFVVNSIQKKEIYNLYKESQSILLYENQKRLFGFLYKAPSLMGSSLKDQLLFVKRILIYYANIYMDLPNNAANEVQLAELHAKKDIYSRKENSSLNELFAEFKQSKNHKLFNQVNDLIKNKLKQNELIVETKRILGWSTELSVANWALELEKKVQEEEKIVSEIKASSEKSGSQSSSPSSSASSSQSSSPSSSSPSLGNAIPIPEKTSKKRRVKKPIKVVQIDGAEPVPFVPNDTKEESSPNSVSETALNSTSSSLHGMSKSTNSTPKKAMPAANDNSMSQEKKEQDSYIEKLNQVKKIILRVGGVEFKDENQSQSLQAIIFLSWEKAKEKNVERDEFIAELCAKLQEAFPQEEYLVTSSMDFDTGNISSFSRELLELELNAIHGKENLPAADHRQMLMDVFIDVLANKIWAQYQEASDVLSAEEDQIKIIESFFEKIQKTESDIFLIRAKAMASVAYHDLIKSNPFHVIKIIKNYLNTLCDNKSFSEILQTINKKINLWELNKTELIDEEAIPLLNQICRGFNNKLGIEKFLLIGDPSADGEKEGLMVNPLYSSKSENYRELCLDSANQKRKNNEKEMIGQVKRFFSQPDAERSRLGKLNKFILEEIGVDKDLLSEQVLEKLKTLSDISHYDIYTFKTKDEILNDVVKRLTRTLLEVQTVIDAALKEKDKNEAFAKKFSEKLNSLMKLKNEFSDKLEIYLHQYSSNLLELIKLEDNFNYEVSVFYKNRMQEIGSLKIDDKYTLMDLINKLKEILLEPERIDQEKIDKIKFIIQSYASVFLGEDSKSDIKNESLKLLDAKKIKLNKEAVIKGGHFVKLKNEMDLIYKEIKPILDESIQKEKNDRKNEKREKVKEKREKSSGNKLEKMMQEEIAALEQLKLNFVDSQVPELILLSDTMHKTFLKNLEDLQKRQREMMSGGKLHSLDALFSDFRKRYEIFYKTLKGFQGLVLEERKLLDEINALESSPYFDKSKSIYQTQEEMYQTTLKQALFLDGKVKDLADITKNLNMGAIKIKDQIRLIKGKLEDYHQQNAVIAREVDLSELLLSQGPSGENNVSSHSESEVEGEGELSFSAGNNDQNLQNDHTPSTPISFKREIAGRNMNSSIQNSDDDKNNVSRNSSFAMSGNPFLDAAIKQSDSADQVHASESSEEEATINNRLDSKRETIAVFELKNKLDVAEENLKKFEKLKEKYSKLQIIEDLCPPNSDPKINIEILENDLKHKQYPLKSAVADLKAMLLNHNNHLISIEVSAQINDICIVFEGIDTQFKDNLLVKIENDLKEKENSVVSQYQKEQNELLDKLKNLDKEIKDNKEYINQQYRKEDFSNTAYKFHFNKIENNYNQFYKKLHEEINSLINEIQYYELSLQSNALVPDLVGLGKSFEYLLGAYVSNVSFYVQGFREVLKSFESFKVRKNEFEQLVEKTKSNLNAENDIILKYAENQLSVCVTQAHRNQLLSCAGNVKPIADEAIQKLDELVSSLCKKQFSRNEYIEFISNLEEQASEMVSKFKEEKDKVWNQTQNTIAHFSTLKANVDGISELINELEKVMHDNLSKLDYPGSKNNSMVSLKPVSNFNHQVVVFYQSKLIHYNNALERIKSLDKKNGSVDAVINSLKSEIEAVKNGYLIDANRIDLKTYKNLALQGINELGEALDQPYGEVNHYFIKSTLIKLGFNSDFVLDFYSNVDILSLKNLINFYVWDIATLNINPVEVNVSTKRYDLLGVENFLKKFNEKTAKFKSDFNYNLKNISDREKKTLSSKIEKLKEFLSTGKITLEALKDKIDELKLNDYFDPQKHKYKHKNLSNLEALSDDPYKKHYLLDPVVVSDFIFNLEKIMGFNKKDNISFSSMEAYFYHESGFFLDYVNKASEEFRQNLMGKVQNTLSNGNQNALQDNLQNVYADLKPSDLLSLESKKKLELLFNEILCLLSNTAWEKEVTKFLSFGGTTINTGSVEFKAPNSIATMHKELTKRSETFSEKLAAIISVGELANKEKNKVRLFDAKFFNNNQDIRTQKTKEVLQLLSGLTIQSVTEMVSSKPETQVTGLSKLKKMIEKMRAYNNIPLIVDEDKKNQGGTDVPTVP